LGRKRVSTKGVGDRWEESGGEGGENILYHPRWHGEGL